MISALLTKAFLSAIVGAPVALGLNIGVLPVFVTLIEQNVFLASVLIAIPVILASTVRIFLIDLVYEKYNIQLDPMVHIKKRLIRH